MFEFALVLRSTDLLTVDFFGANDSCLPGNTQYVPLDQYCHTLELLCRHPSVKVHDPSIILVTPPPVNEYQLSILDAPTAGSFTMRTAENTKRYADACRKVGEQNDLPVVDLWRAFMSKAGWKEGDPLAGSKDAERNGVLQSLLRDGKSLVSYRLGHLMLTTLSLGLHFNPEGYRVMYDELLSVIRERLPDHRPENLPSVYPHWEQAPT